MVSVRGKRYASSGKNGKACKRTRVIPFQCPDTACDLSCGCEWLRMRQTESPQVAIHAAKCTKSDGGSRDSANMTSKLGVSFHSDKKRECKGMGKRIYGIISFACRIPHPHADYAYRLYGILDLVFDIHIIMSYFQHI